MSNMAKTAKPQKKPIYQGCIIKLRASAKTKGTIGFRDPEKILRVSSATRIMPPAISNQFTAEK